jgi:hypothetical protein
VESDREKCHNFIKEEIAKQSTFILSQINESVKTLVNRIPQERYTQMNQSGQSSERHEKSQVRFI